MDIQLIGAGCFGAIIGWYVYYINRYRTDEIQLTDLATVLGVIGGSVVLTLFPEQTKLFGAYGIGLAIGFFGYFIILLLQVSMSEDFGVEWFLDGRRKGKDGKMIIPDNKGGRAMGGGGDADPFNS